MKNSKNDSLFTLKKTISVLQKKEGANIIEFTHKSPRRPVQKTKKINNVKIP